MKMYRWDSELMRQYATGDMIAIAESADQARQLLRDGLDAWIKEHRSYEWSEAFEPFGGDTPDRAGYDKLIALFDADIAKDPTEHVVLYMMGSE